MAAAREALNSFLAQLNDPKDEVFLYRFESTPCSSRVDARQAASRWSSGGFSREEAPRSMMRSRSDPLAQSGQNRKKALVIISDGNDTSSRTDVSR